MTQTPPDIIRRAFDAGRRRGRDEFQSQHSTTAGRELSTPDVDEWYNAEIQKPDTQSAEIIHYGLGRAVCFRIER